MCACRNVRECSEWGGESVHLWPEAMCRCTQNVHTCVSKLVVMKCTDFNVFSQFPGIFTKFRFASKGHLFAVCTTEYSKQMWREAVNSKTYMYPPPPPPPRHPPPPIPPPTTHTYTHTLPGWGFDDRKASMAIGKDNRRGWKVCFANGSYSTLLEITACSLQIPLATLEFCSPNLC